MAKNAQKDKKAKSKKPVKKRSEPKREIPEDIWEQWPDENALQYSRFCYYRDMAYEQAPEKQDIEKSTVFCRKFKRRSLRRMAEEIGLGPEGVRNIATTSTKFRWVERAEAYDADLEGRIRKANEKALIKMTEDHALLGAQMIRKATARLLRIPEEEISAGDLVRLADIGVKIERLARGESTENQRITGEIEEKKTVTVSVEDELKELSVSVLRKMADEYKAKPVEELPTEKILELLREEGEKRP
jgi:hypothetical protein